MVKRSILIENFKLIYINIYIPITLLFTLREVNISNFVESPIVPLKTLSNGILKEL